MKETGRVSPEMIRVGDLLSLYIGCHNETFEVSLRKIIPIPGFFKPINFDTLSARLSKIRGELADIRTALKVSSAPSIHTDYVSALLEAVSALHHICEYLSLKAKWNFPYDEKTYKADLDRYFALVKRYVALGGILKTSFAQAG